MTPDQSSFPQFQAQGDAALLVYLGRGIDQALNARVRRLAAALAADPAPGAREVLPAYCCLQVQFDPLVTDHEQMEAWARQALAGLPAGLPPPGRRVEVPVVYGGEHGPDLEFVASHAGLSQEEVVARHSGRDHLCYLVGFTPGFPFLGGMDLALAAPRLDTPRLNLPPGATGIGGDQTGLYPLGGPGGWRILGRSPALIYDPRQQPPALIEAGDLVRFTPVAEAEFPPPPRGELAFTQGEAALEVLAPGSLTTVQDAGRWGWQHLGVPVSGALDQMSLAAANALVGNPPGAAGLEITLLGPKLKALRPVCIAVTGADLGLKLDGRPAPLWTRLWLQPGQVIQFSGPRDGARAALAVAGGLGAEPMLGSRSAYALGCLGGPLMKGQIITALPSRLGSTPAAIPDGLRPVLGRSITLRAAPGPNLEHFTEQGLATLFSAEYRLSDRADRRGARLSGPAVEMRPGGPTSIVSEPNAPGIVQVPPDGQPMVLLKEQTVGGYAKAAAVITPDLDLLARAMPGDLVRLIPVSPAEAVAAARSEAKRLTRMREALPA